MITDSTLKVYIEKYNIHLKPIDLSLYEPQQRRCGLIGRHLTVFVGDQPPYRLPSVIVTNNLSQRIFFENQKKLAPVLVAKDKTVDKNTPATFLPTLFQNIILRKNSSLFPTYFKTSFWGWSFVSKVSNFMAKAAPFLADGVMYRPLFWFWQQVDISLIDDNNDFQRHTVRCL